MIIETVVASLVPVLAEGLKQLTGKIFGGLKPVTIDDQIKLDNSEIDKLKALATLDTPAGTPSQWVIDLRASSRYIAAWACILIGSYMITLPTLSTPGSELVSVAFGFLFGTRIVANWSKK